MAIAGIVIAVLTRHALLVEREQSEREAEQSDLARSIAFEASLQTALEMSRAETSVFDIVSEALSEAAPGMRSELLLADSSKAHFRQVLVSSAQADDAGCGVMSPDDCPAASRARNMVFPDSTALDACPHLRGRHCSALCVPMSISGNSVGVFHVTTEDGSPPSDAVEKDVEVVARRASERLAMLRAFEVSQTQANSDSLTGLMTRRSLETAVRELHATGTPYSVAYGDLDHFKDLNDTFGHAAGDRALRTFSHVLRDSLRPDRHPGPLRGRGVRHRPPDAPSDEARQVLERVRERLAERIVVADLPPFTVSFGLASSDQADRLRHVVALADAALLSAKAGGRDQVVTSTEPAAGAEPPPSASGWTRHPQQRRLARRRHQGATAQLTPGAVSRRSRGSRRTGTRLSSSPPPPWRSPAQWSRLLEMRNPSPFARVHLMPAVDEVQVKGPSVIDWP